MDCLLFTGSNLEACRQLIGDQYDHTQKEPNIFTPQGMMFVRPGHLIVRDDAGCLYLAQLVLPEKQVQVEAVESIIPYMEKALATPGKLVKVPEHLLQRFQNALANDDYLQILNINDKHYMTTKGL